jgi:hypothetical protein
MHMSMHSNNNMCNLEVASLTFTQNNILSYSVAPLHDPAAATARTPGPRPACDSRVRAYAQPSRWVLASVSLGPGS